MNIIKVSDFLKPQAVIDELKASNKKEVLEELCDVLGNLRPDLDKDKMVGILLDRERLGSTGVGEGVAMPHGKTNDLEGLVACFGKSLKGVTFDSVDEKPVHLFFLLFAPEKSAGDHLKALAKISRLLKRPTIREELLAATSKEKLYEILTQEDVEKFQSTGS